MAISEIDTELTTIAVYYAYARAHALDPATPGAFREEAVSALRDRLEAQGSHDRVIHVLEYAQAGLNQIESAPAETLSAVTYDNYRKAFISRLELAGSAGVRLWPPTSQTVRAQLGDGNWNAAVSRLGIKVSTRGRAIGHISFTDDEYSAAVADFLAASDDHSFRAYLEWVADEKAKGIHRPAGATIRKSYGSWNTAKESARQAAPRA